MKTLKNTRIKSIQQIFTFLTKNTDKKLHAADVAFVFGRFDHNLAKKASELYHKKLIKNILITGGTGKDSGYLAEIKIPEAAWQAALLNIIYKIPKEDIILEINATNGGENCRLGIQKLIDSKLNQKKLILIATPISLRRMNAIFELESEKIKFNTQIQLVATDYIPSIKNPLDVKEACEEYIKLATWPEKGWCKKQKEINTKLTEIAQEMLKEINLK